MRMLPTKMVAEPKILAILNSKMTHFLFESILPKLRGDFYEPSFVYFKDFPIMDIPDKAIEEKVEELFKVQNESPTADTTTFEAEPDRLV